MTGGLHPPLSVILSWPAPNYIDPETRGPDHLLTALAAVLGTLMVMTVLARLWIRFMIQRNSGIDDIIILVAMLPLVGLAIGICLGVENYDSMLHIWDVQPQNYVSLRKVVFSNELCYLFSTSLIKISILLFYRRLTTITVKPAFVYAVWAALAFVVLYCIGFGVLILSACRPMHAYWNHFDPSWMMTHDYQCINEAPALLVASIVSITQDMIAAVLPLSIFWNMKISRKQKIVIASMFLVGLFLCIAGALRVYYIYRMFWATYDVTWESYYVWVWTLVEVLVAPVLASLPAFKVIVWRRLSRINQSSTLNRGTELGLGDRRGSGMTMTRREYSLHREHERSIHILPEAHYGFHSSGHSGSNVSPCSSPKRLELVNNK